MLKALILENFKAFGGRRVIPIRPITLIFGPNSAGKSAILQSLLMLKQTITDPDTGDVPIRLKGSLVNLGSFHDLVFRHETDRVVEVTPIVEMSPRDHWPARYAFSVMKDRGSQRPNCGFGVRLAKGDMTRDVGVDSLPLYLTETSFPIASLVSSSQIVAMEISHSKDELSIRRRKDELWKLDEAPEFTDLDPFERLKIVELLSAKLERELIERNRSESRRIPEFAQPDQDRTTWTFPRANRESSFWSEVFRDFVEIDISRLEEHERDPGHRDFQWEERFGLQSLVELESYPVTRLLRELIEADQDLFIYLIEREAFARQFRLTRLELANGWHVEDLPQADKVPMRNFVRLSENWSKILEFLFEDIGRGRLPNLGAISVELNELFRQLIKGIVYVGPLREYPERHYTFAGAVPTNVGVSGQHAPDLLLSDPELLERVNRTLRLFDVGYRVAADRLKHEDGSQSDVFALRLVEQRTGLSVTMRDVGFGISQVLPVIVQSELAEGNSLLIEQPELHLHPRLQAELADVFIESALHRDNTLIIETHSEHLLLRIMRRIRETSRGTLPDGVEGLLSENVSIIYVQPTENGSVPLVMDLDEDGELLTAWPNGFFEEGFRERFA